jgi:hypothetical protein
MSQSQFGWLGAVLLVSALGLLVARGSRRFSRAFWAGTLGGAAVGAGSVWAVAPWLGESRGWLSGGLLVVWAILTHAAMALSEGAFSAGVLAVRRRRPGRALRGAVLGALLAHAGGALSFLIGLWPSVWWSAPASPFGYFAIYFLPFAPVGGLLAGLGTLYGDIVGDGGGLPTDLPG